MSRVEEGVTMPEKKKIDMVSPEAGGRKLRTTLLISEDLDRMVEVCAAVERKQKSEIVNAALAAYLKDKKELHSLSIK
jgi:hypothetical protein